MVLVYLVLLVVMMFVGGMLIELNPEPLQYKVKLLGEQVWMVQSSVLELIGWSIVLGAIAMCLPYFRSLWLGARERRHLTRQSDELRDDNRELRRDAENARTNARLLEARVAESEERYAQLEAETQLRLTMKKDEPPPQPAAPAPSRWRRR